MSDRVTINSAMGEGNKSDLDGIVDSIAEDILGKKHKK